MRIGKCFCRWMLKSSDAKAQDTLRFLKVESNWFLRRNCRRLGGSCYYVAFLRRSRRLLGSHLPLAQARPRRCRPESNLHLRHFPQRRPSRRYFLYPRCFGSGLLRIRGVRGAACIGADLPRGIDETRVIRFPDVLALRHPMTAICVVLISSVLLVRSDVDLLAEFTRYSKQFVRAISSNMDNSRLWKDGKYYCDAWSCNSLLPCDEKQEQESWEHRCARFGFHVDHRCEVTSQN